MDTKHSQVVIEPGAVVEFAKTVLKGRISLGKGSVVHPTVQILADGGPITIGENNLLEEGAVIHNVKSDDGVEREMVIGSNNVFEVRSRCQARSVGNNNLIQMTASLDSDVTVGDGCVVGVAAQLKDVDIKNLTHYYLCDSTIQQRVSTEPPQAQLQQLEYLRNMIPNYHKIYKPNKT